jgi:glutaconate CoA-transferase subunit B
VGILRPLPGSQELACAATFPGISLGQAKAAVGWPLASFDTLQAIEPPTANELETLRLLHARTAEAHRRPVNLPLEIPS